MNSSTILKKTLPVLLVILIVVGIAVSCTVFGKDKVQSMVSDKDSAYLTVSDGEFTYTITREKAYNLLKDAYGNTVLNNLIDEDILKNEKVNGVSFWDQVTEEEISEEIEKAIFPEGRDKLTEEEIAKAISKYNNDLFFSGYRTEEDIRNYHRLALAKKNFAMNKLELEIKEKENTDEKVITDKEIKDKHESLYQKGYWVLLVNFKSAKEATDALSQLNIEIKLKEANTSEMTEEQKLENFNKWVWKDSKVALTVSEVVKAMIDLYNRENSYKIKEYPNQRLSLNAGIQYTIEGGKFVFNTDLKRDANNKVEENPLNDLYFTSDELKTFNTDVLQNINANYLSYNSAEIVDDKMPNNQKWFVPTVSTYSNGAVNFFAIKIDTEDRLPLEDVKEDVLTKIKEDKLTSAYINTKFAELRKEKGISIYDSVLEENYIANVKGLKVDYKATKLSKEDKAKNVIAKVGDKEYLVDDFFKAMNKQFGMSIVYDRVNYAQLLSNPVLNTVYDFDNVTANEKDRILDKVKWHEYNSEIVRLKSEFNQSVYATYYGWDWETYIKYLYKATNESELRLSLLLQDISEKYANNLKDLSKATEDSELWKRYLANMEMVRDEYYNVKGYHLLITIRDEAGKPTDPKNWTEYQVELAKSLNTQVVEYLKTQTDYKKSLEKVVSEFNKAPKFLADLEQNANVQPVITDAPYVFENIELSKFKTAGLSVEYQDLGNFQNATIQQDQETKVERRVNTMVEPFSKAVKEIWDANSSSKETVIYGNTVGAGKYIETEFGFHVYVNTETIDLPKWNEVGADGKETDVTHVLPTLEQIKLYIKDASDPKLTTKMKTAITTFYNPIAKEIGGASNTAISFLNDQLDLNIQFNFNDFTLANYREYLAKYIEDYREMLDYKAHEAE